MVLPAIFRHCGTVGPGAILCITVLGASLGGCASSRPGDELDERVQALGTWEYRTDGIGVLQSGTLQISSRDGDLVARFRDQWRGHFEAQIRVQGTRMVIALEQFRIEGRITDGRFTGVVRDSEWDVSRGSARREPAGTFRAHRIGSQQGAGERDRYGCASLLRETSYACSPLHPQ